MQLLDDSPEKLTGLLFYPTNRNGSPHRQRTLLLVLLYLGGLCHWLYFYNYGHPRSFSPGDWQQEYYYELVLRESILTHTIPYHVAILLHKTVPFHDTHRFLTIPETILSPQILLLGTMGIDMFVMVNVLLLYSLGFLGSLLIKRKYSLSIFSFTIFFCLFNFNGYITSHLSVGHPWTGYFFLPFFLLYVMELLEEKDRIVPAMKLSLALLAIFMQGSLHIFNECLIFLGLIALFHWRFFKPVFWTLLFSSLLSFFRILPAMLTFYNKKDLFCTGYTSLRVLFDGLTAIRLPTVPAITGMMEAKLYWWEFDIFIGIVGLLVLLYFGIYLRFQKEPSAQESQFRLLELPGLVFILFSLGTVYYYIVKLPIPFIISERVPTRFLLIPVLFLLLISVIRIQNKISWFTKNNVTKVLSFAMLAELCYSLASHSYTWRIWNIESLLRNDFNRNLFHINIIQQEDTLYITCVNVSFLISCFTFLALCGYIVWSFYQTRKTDSLRQETNHS
jgi:hypothetical protein